MVADTADGADGVVGSVLSHGRYPDGPRSQPPPKTISIVPGEELLASEAAFENIDHFGFVLPKFSIAQSMVVHSIIAIARASSARRIEGSNCKFASRQRSPFIAIHGQ